MKTVDAVIVGSGVMGASVAYHLVCSGLKNIVVLERHKYPGLGSTKYATGGFRTQFSTTVYVKVSLLSLKKLIEFKDEIGIDVGYRPYGYLFVARNQNQLSILRQAMKTQKSAGLNEVVEIDKSQIHLFNSFIYTDDLLGGTYCPLDGFINPLKMLHGYIDASIRLGVKYEYGVENIDVIRLGPSDDGFIKGVKTSKGLIHTPCVINAAGAWAKEVGKSAGVAIPVRPLQRQVAITHPYSDLPENMPFTVDVGDGFHLRVREGRVLLLWPKDHINGDNSNINKRDEYDMTFDYSWLHDLLPRAIHRVPCLSNAKIDYDRCWSGLYEMSPDKHALVGSMPNLKGYYLINGSSGHGIMHAPALGMLLSEIIINGQASTIDISDLRPNRFNDGLPNYDNGVL